MATDKKISELPVATVPLSGTEKFEILQGGVNKQVDASDVGVGGSFVPLTLTGNTVINSGGNYLSLRSTGAEISRFVLDGANNIPKILSFRTVDSMRWAIRIEGDETGSEAGATLNFRRYDDSGVFIDAPLSFNRATGVGAFSIGPTAPTATQYTNTTQVATTAFVQTKIDALLTIKTKIAAHTLDANDLADVNLGKSVNFIMDVAAGHDFTIPPNATQAFPVGTQLLVDYINTGATAFVAGAGVTIQSADGLTIAARYKGVVLKKIDTNTWLLQGALTT